MGFFGPPDVGKMKERKNVSGLIKALDYKKDHSVRKAATKALGEIGDPQAVEPLIAALKDEEKDVRWNAALALGEIGDPRAVDPLITALRDDDWGVRRRAAMALGEIGDPLAVEPLIADLRDEEKDVRKEAAWVLGEIGDPRAVEPLIAALKNEYDDGGVTRNAVGKALEELNWQPDQGEAGAMYWACKNEWKKVAELGAPALEALIIGLNAYDFEARIISAEALGKIGDPRAVKPLIAALKIETYRVLVCEAVAKALDKLGWQPDQGEAGALYWIAKRKWDKVATLGSPAVEPLISTLEAAAYIVEKIQEHDDAEIYEAIKKNLVNIGKPAGGHFLDRASHFLDAAAEALGKIGEPAVEPLIKKLQRGYDYSDLRSIRTIARVLVHLYHQGTISEQSKKRILELRWGITRRHIDSFTCGGILHEDNKAIGVDFPL